jgi:LAS superfamily LD-carboxypeptidase LdcB
VTIVAVLVGALGIDVAGGETAREQRERIRRERAEAAAELDVLRAEDEEVNAALDAMSDEVTAQETALTNAEQAVRDAETAFANATAAAEAMTQRVSLLESSLKVMAVQEFITGGRLEIDLLEPEGDDLADWSRRNALARFAIGSATQTTDELHEAQEDLFVLRQQAEQAATQAAQQRDQVASQLAAVTAARDTQAAFAERIEGRIESRLAEAANLAAIDAQLSARITAEAAALARRNAGRRPGTGGSTGRVSGTITLTTVNGITVASSIADNLAQLLNHASADGVELSGWGYRNPQDQQRLREAHCPDPESSPSYACRPPTARPGHSMHERGLAIDFTQGGKTLNSGSSGYRWLRLNASRYGLQNLPGEPWHWSTNGN